MAENLAGENKVWECEHCGALYGTRQGLDYHLKVCEYRPTDDGGADDGGPVDGIDIFGDEEGEEAPLITTVEDLPVYECPDCGHTELIPFGVCPACGAGLSW